MPDSTLERVDKILLTQVSLKNGVFEVSTPAGVDIDFRMVPSIRSKRFLGFSVVTRQLTTIGELSNVRFAVNRVSISRVKSS